MQSCRYPLSVACLLALLAMGVAPIHATPRTSGATFVVTRFDDRNSGSCNPGDCSLREAVIAANTQPGADVILLPGGTYPLTLAGRGENYAATGDLDLREGVIISATGAAPAVMDAGAIDRAADVITGTIDAEMLGVVLRDGDSQSEQGGNLRVRAGAALTMTDSAIRAGHSLYMAGGASNDGTLVLVHSVVEGNRVDQGGSWGGGILSGGRLTLLASSVLSNSVVFTPTFPAVDVYCGGIAAMGTVIIDSSTIAHNSVYTAGYDPQFATLAQGGGICSGGTLTMTNSTVSHNGAYHAGGGGPEAQALGGGLDVYGQSYLNNVTITDNRVETITGPERGGGIWGDGITLHNSLIAGNHTSNYSPESGPDCYATVFSEDYNLIRDTNSCTITGTTTHNVYGVDARLGPLADNGGPTWTHALLPGSPAIDRAGNAGCAPFDQRGVLRPQGVMCDMGAFEFEWQVNSRAFLVLVAR
jgi:CSLREA domain-containing protein